MSEKSRSDDDQKFSTPDSNQKEVETKQETMKFPPNVQGSQSSMGIGTTKEAARPPLGFQGFPKEAETPKATVRPQKVEAEESKGVRIKEAETTQDAADPQRQRPDQEESSNAALGPRASATSVADRSELLAARTPEDILALDLRVVEHLLPRLRAAAPSTS